MCIDAEIDSVHTNERLSYLGGFFCLELTLANTIQYLPQLYEALFYKTFNLS